MSKPDLNIPGLVGENLSLMGGSQLLAVKVPHDLEAHVDELKEIDKVRRKSAEMRRRGHKGLLKLVRDDENKLSLYDKYKFARIAWRFLSKDSSPDDKKEQGDRITRLKSEFVIDAVEKEPIPVLTAAEAMRMFVGVGHLSFSKATILSWYVIVRELYTADKPDWCIGGARAGESGWVTAYSTSQCIRALCELVQVLERTGEFLKKMQAVAGHIMEVSDKNIPGAWRDVDMKRVTKDLQVTLSLASNKIVFKLPEADAKNFNVEVFLSRTLKDIVKAAIGELSQDFPNLIMERNVSIKDGDKQKVRMMGHTYAMDNIDIGYRLVQNASINIGKDRWMELVADGFFDAAKGIRSSMDPSRGYLSSVIDRQLAVSNSTDRRSWEPSELAYAVSAYAHTLKDGDDSTETDRLKLAARLLHADLFADGTLSNRTPFHMSGGVQFVVHTEELLGAVAEVFRKAHQPVDERLAKSMLHYFNRQCDQAEGETIAWFSEFDHHMEQTSLISSVDAVESLGAFNRMLDEGINEIILDHFSVREPKNSGLGLNDLFYPDYGFSTEKSGLIKRESIALTLQDMRTQVLGVQGNSLCSLVLHGPGGTGKTMLVEALANTCNVKLVEVTPSDIAKGGEADIEKRARAVFHALSMLSHVVILFDEFDPILKRRDGSGKDSTSIFTFLTPGMLPKLKALHDSAKEHKVGYVLITNLIRTLDIPAIRKGRFDLAVGIYPPDPLSRAGYFAKLCRRHAKSRSWEGFDLSRFAEVIAKTAGLGMTLLTAKGNFSAKDINELAEKPIGYICGRSEKLFDVGEAEEEFDEGIASDVSGQFAKQEFLEWGCLVAWDKFLLKTGMQRLKKAEKEQLLECWEKALEWPESDQEVLEKVKELKSLVGLS